MKAAGSIVCLCDVRSTSHVITPPARQPRKKCAMGFQPDLRHCQAALTRFPIRYIFPVYITIIIKEFTCRIRANHCFAT